MQLGAFSISLTVKDLAASRDFYSKLGFEPVGGDGEAWQILRNGTTVLGLFQGMFDKNVLTFNPGWDAEQKEVPGFQDVRAIERELAAAGVELESSNTGDSESGPAHLMLEDPDGNPILIDQHV